MPKCNFQRPKNRSRKKELLNVRIAMQESVSDRLYLFKYVFHNSQNLLYEVLSLLKAFQAVKTISDGTFIAVVVQVQIYTNKSVVQYYFSKAFYSLCTIKLRSSNPKIVNKSANVKIFHVKLL